MKKQWGCDAKPTLVFEDGEWIDEWGDDAADLSVPFADEEEEWFGCPRRPILDDPMFFQRMFELRRIRESGFLPYPGAYYEQPNLMVEGLRTMDSALWEVHQIEERKRKLSGG